MDFLRFLNLGMVNVRNFGQAVTPVAAQSDYEDLGTLVQDAHLRRDIARRVDLTPFARDHLDRAA